ncbi:MAG TPA: hypothetical protein VEB21_19455 [Terriglobales bacterium]|nr:hypothetical protein [Terriglobales bacterium]
MKQWRGILGLCLTVATLAAGCSGVQRTMVRRHPELSQRIDNVRTVAVLPPLVRVQELRLTEAAERQRHLESQMRTEIQERLERLLQGRGFTVVPAHLEESELGQDGVLRFALTELDNSCEMISREVYWKGSLPVAEAFQVRSTLGPMINVFADRAGADVLVRVDTAIAIKSAGMRRKDLFFDILAALAGTVRRTPVAGGVMEVQLLDGTTGELLWANRGGAVYFDKVDIEFLNEQVLGDFDLYRLNEPKPEQDAPAAAVEATL